MYEFGSKTGDPLNPQYSGVITQGRDGNLYSTAPYGGTLCSFCGNVFNIAPSGTLSVVYSFNDTTGSAFEPFSGLTLATDGTFYGTTLAGGQFNLGTVFKITASGVPTTLYNFGTCVYPCLEGTFPNAPQCKARMGTSMERRPAGPMGRMEA